MYPTKPLARTKTPNPTNMAAKQRKPVRKKARAAKAAKKSSAFKVNTTRFDPYKTYKF